MTASKISLSWSPACLVCQLRSMGSTGLGSCLMHPGGAAQSDSTCFPFESFADSVVQLPVTKFPASASTPLDPSRTLRQSRWSGESRPLAPLRLTSAEIWPWPWVSPESWGLVWQHRSAEWSDWPVLLSRSPSRSNGPLGDVTAFCSRRNVAETTSPKIGDFATHSDRICLCVPSRNLSSFPETEPSRTDEGPRPRLELRHEASSDVAEDRTWGNNECEGLDVRFVSMIWSTIADCCWDELAWPSRDILTSWSCETPLSEMHVGFGCPMDDGAWSGEHCFGTSSVMNVSCFTDFDLGLADAITNSLISKRNKPRDVSSTCPAYVQVFLLNNHVASTLMPMLLAYHQANKGARTRRYFVAPSP